MDYKYLKSFILTAKHGSFSKAATELRIAQSAVSRQIKLLEESLQQQLLLRSSRRVVLTQQGEQLYRAASDFDRSVTTLFGEHGLAEIRVGVLHGFLETWGVAFITRFCRKESANLRIHLDTPPNLVRGLEARELDLILTNENLQSDLIASHKLLEEELVFISLEPISFERIESYRWISFDKVEWLHWLHKKRLSPRFIQVNSMTAVVNLVRQGLGIAIVPTHILGNDTTLIRQKIPRFKNPAIYLSTHRYEFVPAYLKPMLELLRQAG